MLTARRSWPVLALVLILAAVVWLLWQNLGSDDLPDGFARGNGRIEATEINISSRISGRVEEILVREGDFVEAGQVLARMNTDQLEAQLREAEAQLQRARIGIRTAEDQVVQRRAEREAAVAILAQREAERDAAQKRLRRTEELAARGTTSEQVLDDDRARYFNARAAVAAAEAQVAAADAAIGAAETMVVDANARVDAARATIERIQADIDDATLKSPRAGRVQYRVVQTGEVIAAGGVVLNMVDLEDVYMTFFLPTEEAGRVAIGSEARLVLDAAPEYVVPASVTFVANVAQFTPKTVETEEERQNLMFRVRAHVAPELLRRYIEYVKAGLPGVAFVRLDPEAEWPARLQQNLVQ
ncbi:MAG TPA: HlyD family efflux transporter periplasmic adaptor subunit [Paracoccaceae bacterium]|nr:HlyD family efflux transporter periplasmic adaptor subunit [Paracoccaceae bacterium]